MVNGLEGYMGRASALKRVAFALLFLACCSIAIAGWSAIATADVPGLAPGPALDGISNSRIPAASDLLANHPLAYVVNSDSNNVTIFDTVDYHIVGSIDVGEQSIDSNPAEKNVVVNPSFSRVYVMNAGDYNISIIDTARNTVVGSIDIDNQPQGSELSCIVFGPLDRRIYVATYDGVAVIDEERGLVDHVIDINRQPMLLGFSPSGSVLYIYGGDGYFTAFDIIENRIVADFLLDNIILATDLAVSPDGNYVYIPSYPFRDIDNRIAIIRTSDYSVEYKRAFPEGEKHILKISVNGDSSLLYITNMLLNGADWVSTDISIVDVATFRVLTDIPLQRRPPCDMLWPCDMVFDPLRDIGYLPTGFCDNVTVVDLKLNKTIANVSIGQTPTNMIVFTPYVPHPLAYVANFGSDNVSVIDVAGEKVIKSIDVGRRPADVAVSPDGNYVYVTNFLDNSLSVIDTTNNTVCATIPVGRNPWGVAVRNDEAIVYVVNTGDRNVSTIDVTDIDRGIYRLYDGYDVPLVGHGTHNMPIDIAVNPTGTEAYVSNMGGYLTRINLENGAVSIIDFDRRPRLWMLAADTDGSQLYISCLDDCAYVMALSPLRIDFASASWGIEGGPDGSMFYIGNETGITVVNSVTRNIMKWIPTHAESISAITTDIAVRDDGKRIYATNANLNRVVTINATSNKPDGGIDVGKFPVAIAIKPAISNPLPSQPPMPPNARSYTATADWKPANASMPDAAIREMLLLAGVDLTAGLASPTPAPSAVPGWGVIASCAGLAMACLIAMRNDRK